MADLAARCGDAHHLGCTERLLVGRDRPGPIVDRKIRRHAVITLRRRRWRCRHAPLHPWAWLGSLPDGGAKSPRLKAPALADTLKDEMVAEGSARFCSRERGSADEAQCRAPREKLRDPFASSQNQDGQH